MKSNAIVVSNGIQAFGIGGGQVNRIWATEQAISRAKGKIQWRFSSRFRFFSLSEMW